MDDKDKSILYVNFFGWRGTKSDVSVTYEPYIITNVTYEPCLTNILRSKTVVGTSTLGSRTNGCCNYLRGLQIYTRYSYSHTLGLFEYNEWNLGL